MYIYVNGAVYFFVTHCMYPYVYRLGGCYVSIYLPSGKHVTSVT